MQAPLPASPVARRLAPRFGFDPDRLVRLDAIENEVLAAEGALGQGILRVMEPGHRSLDEVRAELDWLQALAAAALPVARPLPSRDGAYLVTDGDPPWVGVAFERAPGRHLAPDEWTPALFRAHGALVGRLQAHARSWTPSGPRRRPWLDLYSLSRAREAFADDTVCLEAVAEVGLHVARVVPQDEADVGLVHGDLHAWNVLVDDAGGLTAIDFDDAVVGPYLYDLVIPLCDAVTTRHAQEPGVVADAFLGPYLVGFDAVAPRPAGGAAAVAALLALRQADLAIFVQLVVSVERMDPELRSAAKRLRDAIARRDEVVPLAVLRRHFGDA